MVRETKRIYKSTKRAGSGIAARQIKSNYINIALSRERYDRMTKLSRQAAKIDPRKFDGRSGVRGVLIDCLLTLAENSPAKFAALLNGQLSHDD